MWGGNPNNMSVRLLIVLVLVMIELSAGASGQENRTKEAACDVQKLAVLKEEGIAGRIW